MKCLLGFTSKVISAVRISSGRVSLNRRVVSSLGGRNPATAERVDGRGLKIREHYGESNQGVTVITLMQRLKVSNESRK